MNEFELRCLRPSPERLSADRRREIEATIMKRIDDEAMSASRPPRRKRHRSAVVGTTVGIGLLASATVAAATDLWAGPPAPASAKHEVAGLARDLAPGHQMDGTAVELARDADVALYGVRTSAGGYCFTIGAAGGVGMCTLATSAVDAEKPLWFGSEGHLDGPVRDAGAVVAGEGSYGRGSIFGRVSHPDAVSVRIELPGDVPAAKAAVGRNGFFVASLPEAAWRAEFAGAPVGPATAFDGGGRALLTVGADGNAVATTQAISD